MGGWFGGVLTGGLVSVIALGTLSVISEQPAGALPPAAPLVDAPDAEVVEPQVTGAQTTPLSTPVGAMSVDAPEVPDLPEGESAVQPLRAPSEAPSTATNAPADTAPLDVPEVTGIEGEMSAPVAPDVSGLNAQPLNPVFPNPQSQPPQVPAREADLTVSTQPDPPVVVVVPDDDAATDGSDAATTDGDLFVVDLTAPAILPAAAQVAAPINALDLYSAQADAPGDTPVMSIILVDDGSMSASIAALAGLPFPVTIAVDPAVADARSMMETYRREGYEVFALARQPAEVAVEGIAERYQRLFADLPQSIGMLDLGEAGLQVDVDVTDQVMADLAAQGRGYVTSSAGLNMAVRAALNADVPALVVSRDLDAEDQDARIVRRFVEQAVFRALQGSDVVLVGRVRPDTISALILWATSGGDDQVALVPVSAVLKLQN